MEYLGRDGAPFDADFWSKLDAVVTGSVSSVLAGRRIVPVCGPLGAGVQAAKIDRRGKEEEFKDGIVSTSQRSIIEVPQLYSDFWLYWRDIEAASQNGTPVDLSSAIFAAQQLAQHEDSMIFYGVPRLELEGLLTVKGSQSVKRNDWSSGEASFSDVAEAVTLLEQKGYVGRYALMLSPDLYLQLQRIQAGTGILEIERIRALVGKKVLKSTVLKPKTALLVCMESHCIDLLLGQDVTTSYLEAVDMNHHFRIMETALLRIKCPDSIVVFK